MTDDQNCNVGRRVVGALRGEILAADWAGVVDLEIGAIHPPFAAMRAAAVEAAALALDAVRRAMDNKRAKKVIVVPQRIVNVVV